MVAKIVEKPWGHEEWWAVTDKYVGKMLYINKWHKLSLQYHNIKEETIRVISGTLYLVLDYETFVLQAGECAHVKPKTIHRMEAKETDVIVVEVSTPEVDDIVRIADDYNRK